MLFANSFSYKLTKHINEALSLKLKSAVEIPTTGTMGIFKEGGFDFV